MNGWRPAIRAGWKTEYLRGLDDGTIDTLVGHARKMGAPFAQVHIHHVEGAVSRVSADATAFGPRDAPFILNIVGLWMEPTETDRHIATARDFSRAVQPFSTGAPYLNFLGDEGEARIQELRDLRRATFASNCPRQTSPWLRRATLACDCGGRLKTAGDELGAQCARSVSRLWRRQNA